MGARISRDWRVALLCLPVVLLSITCEDPDPTIPPRYYWEATLTGASQVPPVTTSAAGTGTFDPAFSNSVAYTITITTLPTTPITSVTLHQAAAGINAPVSVGLCGTGGAGVPGCVSLGAPGVLSTGTITVSTAQLTQMRAFGTYANVSTVGNPNGELRGQLRIVPPP